MEVGIDVVTVADIRDSIDAFGDRFVRRVFTPAEMAECGRDPERLAAVFAAKEAVLKTLRVTTGATPPRSVEVLGETAVTVGLHPPLDARLDPATESVRVSLSCDGIRAVAVAIRTP